jgi:hypothetical protein
MSCGGQIPSIAARWIVFTLPHRQVDWFVEHLERIGLDALTGKLAMLNVNV